jgi:excisionase family DNA binding protein
MTENCPTTEPKTANGQAAPPSPGLTRNHLSEQEQASQLPRLAFTMAETARILGCSYISVFRLVQRGKLRACSALRHKLIPRAEIEKFLAN